MPSSDKKCNQVGKFSRFEYKTKSGKKVNCRLRGSARKAVTKYPIENCHRVKKDCKRRSKSSSRVMMTEYERVATKKGGVALKRNSISKKKISVKRRKPVRK